MSQVVLCTVMATSQYKHTWDNKYKMVFIDGVINTQWCARDV